MNKFIEVTGKTEDEAVAEALRQLGLTRDEVSVEIIERAKSGFLGLGSTLAKVRVEYTYEESRTEQVCSFLKGLFEKMGVEAEPVAVETENGISVELVGPSLGALIGRRGETLDSIQHLTNYSVNKGGVERVRVTIDAENYRAKRAEALERLANKVAGKVIKYKRNVTLEPMNAYERHIIHAALQNYEGVSTGSIGTEPNRRVVVSYEGKPAPAAATSKYTSREWY